MKKILLSMLVLLGLAVNGLWAQTPYIQQYCPKYFLSAT